MAGFIMCQNELSIIIKNQFNVYKNNADDSQPDPLPARYFNIHFIHDLFFKIPFDGSKQKSPDPVDGWCIPEPGKTYETNDDRIVCFI